MHMLRRIITKPPPSEARVGPEATKSTMKKKHGSLRIVSLVAIGALVAAQFFLTQIAMDSMMSSQASNDEVNRGGTVKEPLDRRTGDTSTDAEEQRIAAVKEALRGHREETDGSIKDQFEGTGAAFIHLGKAAGSTLSRLLRNGCHSFVQKPCHKVENETIVSEMVTDYYHTPDVDKIPQSKHATYFVTVRDPLERLISAFVYLHPKNRHARNEKGNGINARPNLKAYKCFPTLEDFAQAVGRRKEYSDCTIQAQKAVDGRVPIMNHLWGNYKRMVAPLHPEARIFVFRNEYLWDDWVAVNTMLAPNRTVALPQGEEAHYRDMENVKQPIGRDLSEQGRAFLCHAVQQEYEVYLSLLSRAVNLNTTDIQQARNRAQENCPNLVAKRVSLTALRSGSTVVKK